MLFHTWEFLWFALIVFPVYFALRGSRLWIPISALTFYCVLNGQIAYYWLIVIVVCYFALRGTWLWVPWLMGASYYFYAGFNPYYLILVFYSTLLDYLLVALMDHCPARPRQRGFEVIGIKGAVNESKEQESVATTTKAFDDPLLKWAFILSTVLAVLSIGAAICAPERLHIRPTLLFFALLVSLMAVGAYFASRRVWLIISLFNNLALLLFFKYARFVAENLNALFSAIHLRIHLSDPSVLMPLGWEYLLPAGISFFTFQSMSYTIDFYLGKAQRERNFLRFATFVCFFPQLMAGPIERARHLLPQFRQPPPVRLQNLTDGASLFLVGLFKKLALANYLGMYANKVYETPASFDATSLTLGTIAFAWQIFFDFSGYTDMARGLAKIMGFDLILNFNNPYLSTGLGEFWSRWHISLSSWFRDYVYIPLGGNRRGTLFTYRNLFITFLISGIWHGAAWTYVIWGVLHAVGVMITRELERSAFYREAIPAALKRIWVFAYVCFAWIFFRAASVQDALLIVKRIFTAAWRAPQAPALMLALILAVWIYQMMYESRLRALLALSPVRVSLAVCMMLFIWLCSSSGGTFIYFQF